MASLTAQEFDRLLRQALPGAIRLASRLCGPGRFDDAEEVVAAALLEAARGWQRYRGESSFHTWLCGIVVHCHRRRNRAELRRRRRERGAADIKTRRFTPPQTSADTSELRVRIADAVSSLPRRQREAAVLVWFEQLPADEAAKLLETSANNLRVLLHHARTRLRDQLQDDLQP